MRWYQAFRNGLPATDNEQGVVTTRKLRRRSSLCAIGTRATGNVASAHQAVGSAHHVLAKPNQPFI